MADNDAAFLWETEALRSSTARPMPASVGSNGEKRGSDWVTLRQANEMTGIPIKTIRKWARHEHIATYLEDSDVGQLRMVSLSSVQDRALRIGRRGDQVAKPPTETGQPRQSPLGVQTPPTEPPAAEQPRGTMLVPIDAWDKMLLQLGNLHEAGQQLAEARERAVKAETESSFLKERLSEMRTELAEVKDARLDPAPSLEDEPVSAVEVESIDEVVDEVSVTIDEVNEDVDEVNEDVDEVNEDVEEVNEDVEDDNEIVVRNLGADSEPNDSAKSVATYSLEVMKHVFSTWRGRPRR